MKQIVAGLAGLIVSFFIGAPAYAEIKQSAADHFVLRHEARKELAPAEIWQRLIDPASWWEDAHSFSGEADNLSLELKPGGFWREDWEEGFVIHGTLISLREGSQLRFDAPFGPLQAMGVRDIWTITIRPLENGTGSLVIFDEVAMGASFQNLDKIAPAVDRVKQEALESLVRSHLDMDRVSGEK